MAPQKHVLLRIFGILHLLKLLKTLRGGAAAFVTQVIKPLLSQAYVQDAVRLTIVGSAIGLVHQLVVHTYTRLSDGISFPLPFRPILTCLFQPATSLSLLERQSCRTGG